MGDKFWDNVIKNLENSTPSEDELTALARYTGESSNQINAALTARQNNQNSNQIYLKYADDLAQLLDKHVLTEDIHVYMGSDYIEPLNTLKLKDGTSILDVIENPSKFKDRSKEIDALLNGFVVNQERFMSTSLVEENHSHRFAKVNYDFTLKAGSNALFRNIYTNVNTATTDAAGIFIKYNIKSIMISNIPKAIGHTKTELSLPEGRNDFSCLLFIISPFL